MNVGLHVHTHTIVVVLYVLCLAGGRCLFVEVGYGPYLTGGYLHQYGGAPYSVVLHELFAQRGFGRLLHLYVNGGHHVVAVDGVYVVGVGYRHPEVAGYLLHRRHAVYPCQLLVEIALYAEAAVLTGASYCSAGHVAVRKDALLYRVDEHAAAVASAPQYGEPDHLFQLYVVDASGCDAFVASLLVAPPV